MCGSTLFHVLRKQNISLYAFVSSNAVLVKKKGRGIFAILRPFPVGRYFDFYTALSQIPLGGGFFVRVMCGRTRTLARFHLQLEILLSVENLAPNAQRSEIELPRAAPNKGPTSEGFVLLRTVFKSQR